MNDKEAVEMMNRCKHEIESLRGEIGRLRPKAEAYDNLAIVLGLLPQRSVGMGEDLVWTLNKRIREIEQPAAMPAAGASD
jgi:hypothetical protein